MTPPDPPVTVDLACAIQDAVWVALVAAWEVRERPDLSPAATAAIIVDQARAAASVPLNQPGLPPFTVPDVSRVLADALGRWAVAATARSPRFGSPIPACPDEPDEGATMH